MSKPIIEVNNISKKYRLGSIGLNSFFDDLRGVGKKLGLPCKPPDETKEFWALKDLSFKVEEGEVLGIIGHNGAGKSTLLKILSRITEPTSGTAILRGRVASLLEVGTGFHPELTGRENIFLNGAILGMKNPEIKQKFDEIVDFSGCERYIDTPVKRYSSGMYVRLAFAVAAYLDPEILVVDEVLAVGDAEFQKKAIGKMKDVSSNGGRTVLFVSHNMESIQRLCNKSILLENGLINKIGNTNSIIEKYLKGTENKRNLKLEMRKDRSGNGDYKIKSVRTYSDGKETEGRIKIGEQVEFRINV